MIHHGMVIVDYNDIYDVMMFSPADIEPGPFVDMVVRILQLTASHRDEDLYQTIIDQVNLYEKQLIVAQGTGCELIDQLALRDTIFILREALWDAVQHTRYRLGRVSRAIPLHQFLSFLTLEPDGAYFNLLSFGP